MRVAAVDPNSYSGDGDRRFADRIGEITGVSGQFVKVRFTHDLVGNPVSDSREYLFLPAELSMR